MQEEAYAPRDMISMYSRVGDEALRGTSPRLRKYVWRPNRSARCIPVGRFNSHYDVAHMLVLNLGPRVFQHSQSVLAV